MGAGESSRPSIMTDNRESREAIAQLADLFGASATFQPSGGTHCKVVLQWRQRRAVLFIGSTPSDWRATRNNIATARRLLRGLAEMQAGDTAKELPGFMLPRGGR
jgi:hypothetical protein